MKGKCNCIETHGFHICGWCGPMGHGNVLATNQTAEFLAKPKAQIERNRPERPDPGGGRIVQEFGFGGAPWTAASGFATPSLPTPFAYASPLSSLSLGGVIPFNVKALILPYDKLSVLNNQAALMALSQAVNNQGSLGGFSGASGIDTFWIMSPGEVLNFGRQLQGFCGFWFAPWSGQLPLKAAQGTTDVARSVNSIINSFSPQQSIYFNNQGNYLPYGDNGGDVSNSQYNCGPIFAPQFRAHYSPTQTLVVPVQKAPWVMTHCNFVKPNGAVCIPPGAKTMTVAFHGGTPNYAQSWQNNFATLPYGWDNNQQMGKGGRVAAGQWEVWTDWYGFDGQVHRHPSDYFNPQGRGYVSPDHDIEVFDVPRIAAGVNLYWAGNNPIGTNNIVAVSFAFSGGD